MSYSVRGMALPPFAEGFSEEILVARKTGADGGEFVELTCPPGRAFLCERDNLRLDHYWIDLHSMLGGQFNYFNEVTSEALIEKALSYIADGESELLSGFMDAPHSYWWLDSVTPGDNLADFLDEMASDYPERMGNGEWLDGMEVLWSPDFAHEVCITSRRVLQYIEGRAYHHAIKLVYWPSGMPDMIRELRDTDMPRCAICGNCLIDIPGLPFFVKERGWVCDTCSKTIPPTDIIEVYNALEVENATTVS